MKAIVAGVTGSTPVLAGKEEWRKWWKVMFIIGWLGML
jgi:hypothetical protein